MPNFCIIIEHKLLKGIKMDGEQIGEVTRFFDRISVAAIRLNNGRLKKGDIINIKGNVTDLNVKLESIQIDRAEVDEVKEGDEFGVKVPGTVMAGDIVYKKG